MRAALVATPAAARVPGRPAPGRGGSCGTAPSGLSDHPAKRWLASWFASRHIRIMNNDVDLVLGGVRSGKSRYAERIVTAFPAPFRYLATGQAFDDEMRERMAAHRARRDGRWHTREVPLHLAAALDEAGDRPVLVDCLTLWLTNLLLGGHEVGEAVEALMNALARRPAPTVLVGSEVGMGIVPENALARRFRDEAGLLHQRIASVADRVVLVVAGLPLVLKGKAES